jgi:transposase
MTSYSCQRQQYGSIDISGGKPLGDRQALTDTRSVFVLKPGIAWEDLPQEMGCGSGMTCWRRLAAWHGAAVWHRLQAVLLAQLQRADQVDAGRAANTKF